MKKEDLFAAMEDIDERYIEEGREEPVKTANGWDKWVRIAIAAAVVLMAAGAGILYFSKNPITPRSKAPIEKHVAPSELVDDIPEIYKIPHWEDMMDVQRFSILSYDGKEYSTVLLYVHPENRGEFLGTGILKGQDAYSDEIHTIEGTLYSIKGINEEAGVSVMFPGEPDRPYAYVNTDWKPETLGEFIEKLSLPETLKTGLVYMENGADPDIVYEDIPTQMIWDMLLTGTEALPNEGPDFEVHDNVLSISASVDLLGNHNKTITLTEDGYLWTNLLGTGKYFFIGKEKVDAFVKEVAENHQGYIYIYDAYPNENPIPENAVEATEGEIITETTKSAD